MAASRPKPFPALETSGLAVGDPEPGMSRYSVCIAGGGDNVATIEQVSGCKAHEIAELFAASPEMYHVLWWLTRAVRMNGPVGTTAYLISDEIITRAKAVVARVEGKSNTKENRCD